MNILFVSQEKYGEENIRDFFREINIDIQYITFREYTKNLEKIDFVSLDFIFIELLGKEKRKINYIKNCQTQNISSFVNIIYIFEDVNLNTLIKGLRLEKFDYLIKPLESNDVLSKINLYSEERIQTLYESYKMIVKGKLLRPLEHQWKQPLNLIATNLVNLEIKSELSKLDHEDITLTNNKIEKAIATISNTLTNLNDCFKNSVSKNEFNVNSAFEKILEFVTPQMMKHNIVLNYKKNEKNIRVNNYENEFSLSLLVFLFIFTHWLIDSKEETQKVFIDFFYVEGNEKTVINIKFSEELPMYQIYNKFDLEFFVVKELLKRLGFIYQSTTIDNMTLVKLIL